MKAIKLNLHFRLPDDFTGDLNDAIEEMLKYRRKENKGHSENFDVDPEKDLYENFWEMINTTDRVLLGEVWMAEYDSDSGEWIHFPELKIDEHDGITIHIKVDDSCDMAAVYIDDECVMSGNFWDFHPGCHGIDEYGEFGSFDDLAIKILAKLTKEGKKAKIVKKKYKFDY